MEPEEVSSTGSDELPTRAKNDPVPFIALGLSLAGYLPFTLYESILGFGYFGPLAVPAIVAMVGVLFAVIGVLRAVDWQDQRTLRWSVVAGVLGLLRLFVLPLL